MYIILAYDLNEITFSKAKSELFINISPPKHAHNIIFFSISSEGEVRTEEL